MVQHLAIHGLPCHDCVDRAARELGRFLVHVQELEPEDAADLVANWAEAKSNGFVTRLGNGRGGDVRKQIRRIVRHVAGEEDFGGRLYRMKSKLASGRYRVPIDLPTLMAKLIIPDAGSSTASNREEERIILVDKNLSVEGIEAIWEGIHEKMLPHQPGDIRRRPAWWRIIRSVILHLGAHGGESLLPKTVQATFGGNAPTVKSVLDKLVAAGVIEKGKRRYARPIAYRIVVPIESR